MQRTSEEPQRNLQVQCTPDQLTDETSITEEQKASADEQLVSKLEEMIQQTRNDAADLANALAKQIKDGEIEVETRGRQITVRIKEKGSFASGSASLQGGFDLVLHDIRDVLKEKPGQIMVQGHTDNIAISTSRFRSNWELSSARAVSVAEELLSEDVLSPTRFTVSGFSYTRPLASNETAEDRARNRRVEIVINQGIDAQTRQELSDLKEVNPTLYNEIDVKLTPRFNLRPDEIF